MPHFANQIETELETDGRWIAEIVDVPGVMAYGATEREATASAQALAHCLREDALVARLYTPGGAC
jgi:predicted RNase H-like HicB family nuclease